MNEWKWTYKQINEKWAEQWINDSTKQQTNNQSTNCLTEKEINQYLWGVGCNYIFLFQFW